MAEHRQACSPCRGIAAPVWGGDAPLSTLDLSKPEWDRHGLLVYSAGFYAYQCVTVVAPALLMQLCESHA